MRSYNGAIMSQHDAWNALEERIRSGQPGVREELYERLRSLASLSPGFMSREEFRHELYLRVLRRLLDAGAGTDAEEIRCIRAYCEQSARRLRQRLIGSESTAPASLEGVAALSPVTEDAPDRRMDFVAALESGLATLTPLEREVLRADFQGRSPRQISQAFAREGRRVSVMGVYSSRARARRRLHRHLVKAGYDSSTARRWLRMFGGGAAIFALVGLRSLSG